MLRQAIFSSDSRYRYLLWRQWDYRKPCCMFVGLNPSTANEITDDPTIRRCMGFAQMWGYGTLCMANLFACVATDPHDINLEPDLANNTHLLWAASYSSVIIAAWGGISMQPDKERAKKVLSLLAFHNIYCLGRTKCDQPKHPLYLPYTTEPSIYRAVDPKQETPDA